MATTEQGAVAVEQGEMVAPATQEPVPPAAKGKAGRGRGKKRKTKMPRDLTAPRQPLTGYVRYLNDRREALRTADPTLSFAEVTKRLASEWGRLAPEEKQQYLDAAELDRERYIKEWTVYKESDAYKAFKQQQQERKEAADASKASAGAMVSSTAGLSSPPTKRQKSGQAKLHKGETGEIPTPIVDGTTSNAVSTNGSLQGGITGIGTPQTLGIVGSVATPPARPKAAITPSSAVPSIPVSGVQEPLGKAIGNNGSGDVNQRETDIPIFTEQFLQHNKLRETELRQLRKANTDYEQQNAILQKHIESMRGAVDRTKGDIMSQRARTTMLRGHLTALQDRLTRGLTNVTLPGGLRLNKQNVEQFMESLRSLAAESKSHAAVKQAREFLSRMEMPA